MARKKTRRQFLQQTASAAVGFWVAGQRVLAESKSPNEKLNIGIIGVAGQGGYDTDNVVSEEIVALCDVDEKRAGQARERFSKAAFYTDFRKLLDQKGIDAVVIATPDHTHAVATMAALKAGKHVYCEKPLTHSVYETHVVMETARKMNRVTQIGTQTHASSNYRRVVELIQTKAIGEVQEVHAWVKRSWSGGRRPDDTRPIPEGLHYDLWLGPAPYRPYHPAYLPAKWRGWWDFGGGTLADMGCHYLDLAHWALKLDQPVSIEAEGPPVDPESCPPWLIVRYEYPKRDLLPPVKLTWYHGGQRPPHFAENKLPEWKGDGVLFVGTQGMMLADYGHYVLLPQAQYADFKPPDPFIPESVGHHKEWIEACKTGGRPLCNFDYAAALTKTVLLGNIAYRSGRKIQWDAARLDIPNAPEAMKFIRPPYREGWTL